ncbi:hypothetical protein HYALB_00006761 [Hymenoscyphus albidus]|uniref:Uncharacterized protein n=1 Tax=Hymenoscyphus albidus TaxID=595503 RepID=A0A9N9M656_9HELO|nr:hypothetical protein HYALB_00006761 [Hymenoscyphus albidus]
MTKTPNSNKRNGDSLKGAEIRPAEILLDTGVRMVQGNPMVSIMRLTTMGNTTHPLEAPVERVLSAKARSFEKQVDIYANAFQLCVSTILNTST